MKSNNVAIGIALLFLVFAVASSIMIWQEISLAVKVGMFAFGFGSGVGVGTLIAKRVK